MDRNIVDVEKFTNDNLKRLIRNPRFTDYFYNYLAKHNCETIISENSYVDKHYLIDYSNFYSRTFTKYERFCKRIHFFSHRLPSYNEDDFIRSFISDKTYRENFNEEHYLGYIIKKPIPKSYIGRSLLKVHSYISDNENDTGVIDVKHHVNFFGLSIPIRSLYYQQQDTVVGACATASLWMILDKLNDLFGVFSLAPSEITKRAMEFLSLSRSFPSGGLNQYQIFSFLKSLNLEVEYPDPDYIETDERFLKSLIYAYVKFGLPLIASLTLRKPSGKGKDDYHVALITGFKMRYNSSENKADNIAQLFIHDDQIGPYCVVSFGRNARDWNYQLRNVMNYSSIQLDDVFVPIYHKIRLPFIRLYRSIEKIYTSYRAVIKDINQYEIFLITVKKYKKELISYNSNILSENRSVIFSNLPNYIWIIRFHLKNSDKIDLIHDATNPFLLPIDHAFLIENREELKKIKKSLKQRFPKE